MLTMPRKQRANNSSKRTEASIKSRLNQPALFRCSGCNISGYEKSFSLVCHGFASHHLRRLVVLKERGKELPHTYSKPVYLDEFHKLTAVYRLRKFDLRMRHCLVCLCSISIPPPLSRRPSASTFFSHPARSRTRC